MRKLILLIIAVICADAGFVAYRAAHNEAEMVSHHSQMRDDRTGLAANSSNNLIESPQTTDTLAGTDDSVLAPDAPAELVPTRAIHHLTNTIKRSPAPRRSSIARLNLHGARKNRRSLAPVEFQNTVIFYAAHAPAKVTTNVGFVRTEQTDLRSYPSNQLEKTSPRRDNRSLIARALPSIKKPYDWIKAIGSKLY